MKYIQTYDEINEEFLDDAWSWIKDHAHLLLPIAEIGSMFIPVIGPFLAMGFGLGDAALYAKEGDKTSAGISAAFSVLPGIGAIATKIPGIKQLGKEGMEQLGKKVIGKEAGALTKTEQEVLQDISKNQKLIKQETASVLKDRAVSRFNPKGCKLSGIVESIQYSILNENTCNAAIEVLKYAGGNPKAYSVLVDDLTQFRKALTRHSNEIYWPKANYNSGKWASKESVEELDTLLKKMLDHRKKHSNGPFNDTELGEYFRSVGEYLDKIKKKSNPTELTKWRNEVKNYYSKSNEWDFFSDGQRAKMLDSELSKIPKEPISVTEYQKLTHDALNGLKSKFDERLPYWNRMKEDAALTQRSLNNVGMDIKDYPTRYGF